MALNPEVVLKTFQEITQLRPPLDNLEARVIGSILHKSIEKLLIINEHLPGKNNTEQIGYRSFLLRMQTREKITPPEVELPEDLQFSSQVKKQVGFLLDVLQETLDEIIVQGTHAYMTYTLCCENLTMLDNLRIKQESQDFIRLINFMEEKVNLKTNNLLQTQHYLLESTGPCLDKVYVNTYVKEHMHRIFNRIQHNTKVERNTLEIKEKETALLQSVMTLESEIEEETKIYQELQNHISFLTTDLMRKLELWTNRYNSEIDTLDIQLLQMKSKRDEQTEDFKKLSEVYTERLEELILLKGTVEEHEREKEIKIVLSKAAAKIQRWWRNHLLRKRLRPKKRSAKEKKSILSKQGMKRRIKQ